MRPWASFCHTKYRGTLSVSNDVSHLFFSTSHKLHNSCNFITLRGPPSQPQTLKAITVNQLIMFRNMYDTDVTVWSPEGRLLQASIHAHYLFYF